MDVDKKPDVTLPAAMTRQALSATAPVQAPAVSAPRDIPQREQVAAAPAFTSPQSKRNLEILVEALCHLEGEGMADAPEASSGRFRSLGGSESQVDSSNSDQEDSKSESSGRDSPSLPTNEHISHHRVGGMTSTAPVGLETQTATLHVSTPQLIGTTLPAAAALQMLNPQLYCPPGYYIQMNTSS